MQQESRKKKGGGCAKNLNSFPRTPVKQANERTDGQVNKTGQNKADTPRNGGGETKETNNQKKGIIEETEHRKIHRRQQ